MLVLVLGLKDVILITNLSVPMGTEALGRACSANRKVWRLALFASKLVERERNLQQSSNDTPLKMWALIVIPLYNMAGFCYYPVDFHAHSGAHAYTLPHTRAHSCTGPHVPHEETSTRDWQEPHGRFTFAEGIRICCCHSRLVLKMPHRATNTGSEQSHYNAHVGNSGNYLRAHEGNFSVVWGLLQGQQWDIHESSSFVSA